MAEAGFNPIALLRSTDDLRVAVASMRKREQRIGLVPTMGALHDGHLSLVEHSNRECDTTIVTIFVNPTQFAPHEDLDKYPRTLTQDLDLLATRHVPVVFAPTDDQIYPSGFSTFVDPPAVARPWEGESRPQHFRGVATVVLKLFNLVQADVAYFGQKDYQQCLVVQRMVEDLGVPTRIRICPIVREPDGLALSSRNRYLSSAERVQALAITHALQQAGQMADSGERDAEQICGAMHKVLNRAGISHVEYATVVHPDTLVELERIEEAAIALIAASVGKTRLIDNCYLK